MKRMVGCALAMLLLTGCGRGALVPYSREMGELALVRVMGVDISEQEVELTVSAGSQGQQEPITLSARGQSVSAAALNAKSIGDSYIYYGHMDQLLLGEDAAQETVPQVLDYLSRQNGLGLGVQFWVVRGATARQAMDPQRGTDLAQRLGKLGRDGRTERAAISRTAMELMSVLARGGSTYLPALVLNEAEEQYSVLPGGYAIIRAGKLVCFTDTDTALGLELLEGRTQNRVDDLTLDDGTQVSLTLAAARVSVRPIFSGGEFTGLNVACTLPAQVVQTDRQLTQGDLDVLERKLGLLEGERAVYALELSQYWDADFLQLEHRSRMASPARSAQIEAQWHGAFRGLDIKVQVYGKIDRTFETMEQ